MKPQTGYVEAIQVGGEWHCVEDGSLRLIPHIAITEQCDDCGGNGFTMNVNKSYTCDGCGSVYGTSRRHQNDCVWYEEQAP